MNPSSPDLGEVDIAGLSLIDQSQQLTQPVLGSTRGRPSKKRIQAIISASRGFDETANHNARKSLETFDTQSTVSTSLGVGSLLNPDLSVCLRKIDYSTNSRTKRKLNGQSVFGKSLGILAQLGCFVNKTDSYSYLGFYSERILGAFSVKLETVQDFLHKRPGFDAYFVNHEVIAECLFANPWRKHEAELDGFSQFAANCLRINGYPETHMSRVLQSRYIGSLALTFATPDFWQSFLVFANKFLNTSKEHSSADWFENGYSRYEDALAECLFVEFLEQNSEFKSMKMKASGFESKLDRFLLDLRAMKDVACEHKNSWILAKWSNYADLYQLSTLNSTGKKSMSFANIGWEFA